MSKKTTILSETFKENVSRLEDLLNTHDDYDSVAHAMGIPSPRLTQFLSNLRFLGATIPRKTPIRGFLDVSKSEMTSTLFAEYNELINSGMKKFEARRMLAKKYQMTVSSVECCVLRLSKRKAK